MTNRQCAQQVQYAWLHDLESLTGYETTGTAPAMFANRLSWFYNFKGPSISYDTGGAPLPSCPCMRGKTDRSRYLSAAPGWVAALDLQAYR